MSIVYKHGDMFDSTAGILVCPVNIVGVMGKGLALEFKKRYPVMYTSYMAACENNLLAIGKPWLWFNEFGCAQILCFPTKSHWRERSDLWYIERGLETLVRDWDYYTDGLDEKSTAFPMLGCGLGSLQWRHVKPVMDRHLVELDVLVEIWE